MISVIGSLKGGSGKSTLTFNLGVWLLAAQQSVRVHDLDPQATLSDVIAVRREEAYKPHLTLAPWPTDPQVLRTAAGEVLIDVGTADMAAMQQAFRVADRVIVPVPPSQADLWSTQRFIRLIRESTTTMPEILVFINRADTQPTVRETAETAAALVTLPQAKFIKRRLGLRTAFRRSFSEGLAVFELEPHGKAAWEFTALAASLYPRLV